MSKAVRITLATIAHDDVNYVSWELWREDNDLLLTLGSGPWRRLVMTGTWDSDGPIVIVHVHQPISIPVSAIEDLLLHLKADYSRVGQ